LVSPRHLKNAFLFLRGKDRASFMKKQSFREQNIKYQTYNISNGWHKLDYASGLHYLCRKSAG